MRKGSYIQIGRSIDGIDIADAIKLLTEAGMFEWKADGAEVNAALTVSVNKNDIRGLTLSLQPADYDSITVAAADAYFRKLYSKTVSCSRCHKEPEKCACVERRLVAR